VEKNMGCEGEKEHEENFKKGKKQMMKMMMMM